MLEVFFTLKPPNSDTNYEPKLYKKFTFIHLIDLSSNIDYGRLVRILKAESIKQRIVLTVKMKPLLEQNASGGGQTAQILVDG